MALILAAQEVGLIVLSDDGFPIGLLWEIFIRRQNLFAQPFCQLPHSRQTRRGFFIPQIDQILGAIRKAALRANDLFPIAPFSPLSSFSPIPLSPTPLSLIPLIYLSSLIPISFLYLLSYITISMIESKRDIISRSKSKRDIILILLFCKIAQILRVLRRWLGGKFLLRQWIIIRKPP